jgi:hypothetical protein
MSRNRPFLISIFHTQAVYIGLQESVIFRAVRNNCRAAVHALAHRKCKLYRYPGFRRAECAIAVKSQITRDRALTKLWGRGNSDCAHRATAEEVVAPSHLVVVQKG